MFRQTSSNMAHGHEWRMSIGNLSNCDIKPLTEFMEMKITVNIKFKQENKNILIPMYALQIIPVSRK